MKHKNKLFFAILCYIIIQVSLSFLYGNIYSKPLREIDKSKFIEKETFCFIKYSRVIYTYKNQKVKIPIFGGSGDDVLYADLLENQKYDYSILSNIAIPIKDKNAKMTLKIMLDFYKNTFFKNIDISKPSAIDVEQDVWFIYYNFYYEKIPCNVLITIGANEENLNNLIKKKKLANATIDDMEFFNKAEYFFLNITIGEHREP
jgi:hypothetical protein